MAVWTAVGGLLLGVAAILGAVGTLVAGRSNDLRGLLQEYREAHDQDRERIEQLEGAVEKLQEEDAECRRRLKSAEEQIAALRGGGSSSGWRVIT